MGRSVEMKSASPVRGAIWDFDTQKHIMVRARRRTGTDVARAELLRKTQVHPGRAGGQGKPSPYNTGRRRRLRRRLIGNRE
jgi:hypothetical protein